MVVALTESRTLFELGLIVVLAAAAPLIAQVLRLPSILLLLALGFGAGAVGALDPNAVLGANVISGIVSIAVGIILFDAGLDLNFSKLTDARVVRRLLSIGILLTWGVAAVASYLCFGLSWEVALVLGAVLVVSGPTVVGPLLSFIRPSKAVDSVLMWEGTFADPIGATLGVIVFNAVLAGHAKAGKELEEFLLNIGVGAGLGLVGAGLILAWVRWFKPNPNQVVSGTLMFVVAAVVAADLLRDDSGLITGLVIGAVLVNRPPGGMEPKGLAIQSAKLTRAYRDRIATLTTFLIGTLFIILSARVSPHQIAAIGWVSLGFVAILVLVARPLAVTLSSLGSQLKTRERAFVAWMAPRGIVAAATSSTFALGLSQAGVGGGPEKLIPITFIVITATALIYGLSGGPVARALGVASTGPGGVLLVGATPVGRTIARALQDRGLTVRLWTARDADAKVAQDEGLTIYPGDPTEDATSNVPSDLDQLEYGLVVGDDDALCAMIATDLSEFFGRDRVFQLPPKDGLAADFYTRVPLLFHASATHKELLARIERGARIASRQREEGATARAETASGRPAGTPMFVLTPGKDLRIIAAGEKPSIEPGQELISLS